MSKEEQFRHIYKTYKKEVFKVAMYLVKDHEEAQDITQQAFYKYYINYESVRNEDPKAYLFQILRNLDVDNQRVQKRVLPYDMEELEKEVALCSPDVAEEILDRIERNAKSELCSDILTRLYVENPMWYEALIEVYYHEKTFPEAAKALGISQEILNNRLYRARKWIRKNYRKEYRQITGWTK